MPNQLASTSQAASARHALLAISLLALAALGGCDDAAGPDSEPAVSVIALALSEDSVRLAAGDSLRLTAQVTGAAAAAPATIWSSSDTTAAAVDQQGLIRARAPGSAVVRARAGAVGDSVLVTVTAAPVPVPAEGAYRVTVLFTGDLLNSGGRYPPPRPTANLNDRGQVVFSSAAGGAYLWDRGTLVSLGPGEAWDINERGEIAGANAGQAVLWDANHTPRVLYGPPGTSARAVAVNESGQVAAYAKNSGFCGTGGRCGTVLVRITGDSVEVISQKVLEATAMNDSGWVVGYHNPDHLYHPFVIRDTVFTELTWGGSYQYVWDVNSSGVVVGSGGSSQQATYWDATGAHPLPGGAQECVAMGINDAGTIVGTINGLPGGYRRRATVWRDGAFALLEDSIGGAPFKLTAAIDVNNRGQIIAIGNDSRTGASVFVLLDPNP